MNRRNCILFMALLRRFHHAYAFVRDSLTAQVDSYRLPRTALRILRGPFMKNVAVLASGTALAQVLTVLAYPILMRLYNPGDFGLFALFGALNMTLVAIASGRYELAIVLAKTGRRRRTYWR
jgi:hypothetical protein